MAILYIREHVVSESFAYMLRSITGARRKAGSLTILPNTLCS
jgi:hypothetical protein